MLIAILIKKRLFYECILEMSVVAFKKHTIIAKWLNNCNRLHFSWNRPIPD